MRLLNLLSKVMRPREPRDMQSISTAVHVLLDNPAYQNAREEILRDIVEQWLASAPNARDERESLYMQAHALGQIDGKFNTFRALNSMKKDRDNVG